jgi:hypothetical protein
MAGSEYYDEYRNGTINVDINSEDPISYDGPTVKYTFKDAKRSIEYKYNELNLINELLAYVNETYSQHYSQSKFQTTEFIIDNGHGMGFCLGNVIKYAQRYGKKEGHNRKDLLKVLHYALIALHTHDLEHGNTTN